ncbi:unnamed protein product [Dicrocoelium dendriticum]|nr:unnamed protein product [Dicrocoelium dendriticum]
MGRTTDSWLSPSTIDNVQPSPEHRELPLIRIVSVLFCGITQAHYTYHNLSNASKLWTKQLFELLNFLSENFVFAYIGVSTFTFEQHYWNAGFVFIAILACIVARAVSVYPLSALINLCRGHRSLCDENRRYPSPSSSSHESCNAPNDILDATFVSEYASAGRRTAAQGKRATGHVSTTKISMNMQHMLFFSGLRGAMAFSLAIRNTSSAKRKMFFSTTIVVVMSTVLLCGCLAMSMLNWLRIRTCIDGDQGSDKQTSDTPPSAHSCFNRCWSRFDKFYLTPLLTNRGPLLTDSVPRCCSWLAKLVTTTEQLNQTFDSLSVRSQLCEFVNDGDQPGGGSAVLFLQDKEVLNHVSSSKQLDVIALDSDSRQVVGNPLITPANYPDKSSSPHLRLL